MSVNKLLVILCDGFKWDYFDQDDLNLPGLRRLINGGTKSDFLEPVFPSLSFPNYYSIMTGLFCEDHGMVGNFMYDEEKGEKFSNMINAEAEHSHWWEYAEPFWITAVKQGKRTCMFEWPGGQISHKGTQSTHVVPVNKDTWSTISDLEGYIQKAVHMFKEDSIDMAGIYVGELDIKGHELETNSTEFCQKLRDFDAAIGKLLDTLETEALHNNVNIVIFSDHGMTDISTSRSIDISGILRSSSVKMYTDCGHMCNIWPHQDKLEEVYDALKNIDEHISVYRKEEIPDKWGYKNHRLVPPIVIVAHNGWFILTPETPTVKCKGWHGYAPEAEDMRGILLLEGPDIKQNNRVGPVRAVDVYQILCQLLCIAPLPHSGDSKQVENILKQ